MTSFSRAFAACLRGVMAEYGVTQQAVAANLGRSHGYVSEHVSGKRPIDTDLLSAVAEIAGIDPSALMTTLASRMSTRTATVTVDGEADGWESERESGSRLSESNRRPIHYE